MRRRSPSSTKVDSTTPTPFTPTTQTCQDTSTRWPAAATDRLGHDRRYAMNIAKIRRELGWQPAESLASGLRRTVRWYLDNRAWWEPIRSGRYRGERLGRGAARREAAP